MTFIKTMCNEEAVIQLADSKNADMFYTVSTTPNNSASTNRFIS